MKTNNKANTIGSIVCILLAGFLLTQLWTNEYYVWGIIVFLILMAIVGDSIESASKSDLLHSIARKALAREQIGLLTDESEMTHEVTVTLKIKTKGTKILSVDSVDLESKSEDNQK